MAESEARPRDAASAAERRTAAAALNRRRGLEDRLATRFVTASGLTIIAAILAILFVIAAVALPLAAPPRAAPAGEVALPAGSEAMALLLDEYQELAFVATRQGVGVLRLATGAWTPPPPSTLGGASVTSAAASGTAYLVLGLSDGRVLPVHVSTEVAFEEGGRTVHGVVEPRAAVAVDPSGEPVSLFRWIEGRDGPVVAAAVGPRQVTVVRVTEQTSLVGDVTRSEERVAVSLDTEGTVTALALDARGDDVVAGTSTGRLVRVDLREGGAATAETVDASGASRAAVTVLGWLNGDRTLVAGGRDGAVSTWQVVQDERGSRGLARIHRFPPHAAAVVGVAPSRRDKGFVTADAAGGVRLHYATTGRTLLDLGASGSAARAVTMAPKADGVAVVDASGRIRRFAVDNPHPEVTLGSLFGKVWYEGYARPEWVWQSTGATDDFEAKLSLTPLVYGTLKGTFYALLVAIPLALMGALYTSQFMHPGLKSYLKPTVEIMAALPSVVLGFLGGLWLAPMLERAAPGVLLVPVVVPLLTFAAAAVWLGLPASARRRLPHGLEIAFLLPIVLLGVLLALKLGAFLEAGLLAGDYRTWLASALGVTYDQRNSLVVGLAMGFAVIPIIFTVAEDSLAAVPYGLTAGSLALGATRWQTALRVVLPTASPGIFSAVMIGFGRAVGETMIVLMATGNTPVMDSSLFNGFRALSANIAVELPEAPEGGTLFRVLFLAALLLFAMTFVVNTAAELVRLRLRKKYRTFE
ncbi:MAG: ABC transporter permease subunit [Acidobacteria bacterium]|nr:MAG: ABC transporter permease subunit [Acidobacteriota bacterium]